MAITLSEKKEEDVERTRAGQNSESQLDPASKKATSPIEAIEKNHTQRIEIQRRPSGKIAYLLLYFGIIALVSSLIFNSSILAFIGLALVLWGALFFYVKPVEYVRKDLLEATALPSLININRILNELECDGKPIHFPPRSLKELKEPVLFIPKKGTYIPHAKEVTEQEASSNPEGISIIDPGQGLLLLYEQKLGTDFTEKDLDYLKRQLPKLLVEDLELVDHIKINEEDDTIHVRIDGSIYQNLCRELKKQTQVSLLVCPLCNSIACALAKVTDKAVIIEKMEVSPDEKTVDAWFRLIRVQG